MIFKGHYKYLLREGKYAHDIVSIPIKDENDPRVTAFIEKLALYKDKPEFEYGFKVVNG